MRCVSVQDLQCIDDIVFIKERRAPHSIDMRIIVASFIATTSSPGLFFFEQGTFFFYEAQGRARPKKNCRLSLFVRRNRGADT